MKAKYKIFFLTVTTIETRHHTSKHLKNNLTTVKTPRKILINKGMKLEPTYHHNHPLKRH